jgi:hypothetical protein
MEIELIPNPDIVLLNSELIDFESVSAIDKAIETTVLYYQAKGYNSLQINEIIMNFFGGFN